MVLNDLRQTGQYGVITFLCIAREMYACNEFQYESPQIEPFGNLSKSLLIYIYILFVVGEGCYWVLTHLVPLFLRRFPQPNHLLHVLFDFFFF